jgi:hypothetical protein
MQELVIDLLALSRHVNDRAGRPQFGSRHAALPVAAPPAETSTPLGNVDSDHGDRLDDILLPTT